MKMLKRSVYVFISNVPKLCLSSNMSEASFRTNRTPSSGWCAEVQRMIGGNSMFTINTKFNMRHIIKFAGFNQFLWSILKVTVLLDLL